VSWSSHVRRPLCRWPFASRVLAHTTTVILWTLSNVHKSTLWRNGRVTGCPSWIKCSLACAPLWERQTVVLAGHPESHWWSGAPREYQTDFCRRTRPWHSTLFHARWCALAHDPLVAKSKTMSTLDLSSLYAKREIRLRQQYHFENEPQFV
jgi:hypothetical protein